MIRAKLIIGAILIAMCLALSVAGQDIEFVALPDFALEIIGDGGLLEHIKKKG